MSNTRSLLAENDSQVTARKRWMNKPVSSIKQMSYLTELSSSKDISDLKQRVISLVNDWGFSDFTYVRQDSLEEIEGSLHTLSEEQTRVYKEEAFYEHDIFQDYIRSNTNPIFLSTIENFVNGANFVTEPICRNRELLSMIRSFGYLEWYNIPMRVKGHDAPLLFSVSIKHGSIIDVQHKVALARGELHSLSQALNYICSTKFQDLFEISDETKENTLSPRPIQVLQVLANGSCPSLKAAAHKLGISVDTVNQHIATARESLGATSTYNAITIALRLGLIGED